MCDARGPGRYNGTASEPNPSECPFLVVMLFRTSGATSHSVVFFFFLNSLACLALHVYCLCVSELPSGHMLGARNVPFGSMINMDEKLFKSPDQLREGVYHVCIMCVCMQALCLCSNQQCQQNAGWIEVFYGQLKKKILEI